jgi:hypothetical protein
MKIKFTIVSMKKDISTDKLQSQNCFGRLVIHSSIDSTPVFAILARHTQENRTNEIIMLTIMKKGILYSRKWYCAYMKASRSQRVPSKLVNI